ncbi:unnamed protein product [Dracunculus medinensis]|uniref:DNA-directed RNA polymerase subunit n=1 Tax=Dracunculus medinensis TaxID=318479 RepID=A0A0N4UDF6_DRAME|nr:unnamed protein product [Dracunculus medinensis]
MLPFCPICGALLNVDEGEHCFRFSCRICPYVQPIIRLVKGRHIPSSKAIDVIIGGPRAWDNAQITNETCPRCRNSRAYYLQIQTRSADEPMTIFYRCASSDCAHRWKE